MMTDGERSLSINLLLVIILWGFGSYVFIVQTMSLAIPPWVTPPLPCPACNQYAFLDADWLVFDLGNHRMTFIENFFSYGFFFLGLLRMMSVFTALGVMDREQRWGFFWDSCERQRF